MNFLSTFLGSFYSAALYARLRTVEDGYGVRYSVLLFGFVAVGSMLVFSVAAPEQIDHLLASLDDASPTVGIALILALALVLRASMLLALAIAAKLTALAMKLPLTYAGGFRMAAVSYTPVAVFDALAFCLYGQMMNRFMLFACGVAMLLAALRATR